jgi:hypothetical protein
MTRETQGLLLFICLYGCAGKGTGADNSLLGLAGDDACALLDSVMSSPAACGEQGCFQPLAEIDCVSGLGPLIPVRLYYTDSRGEQSLLRDGQVCAARYIEHRDVKDGFEQFMAIELKPKGPGAFYFEAGLTIFQKAKGEVVAIGGTACGAMRRGEVRKQKDAWVMKAY